MTWNLPLPSGQLAALAGVLGALTIAAYVLKMRRRRHEVPFSKLWQRVLRERESSSLWRRLKRLISLAAQLAFLALLLGAATDPRMGGGETSARHVVLIVDASASMKARDDGPDAPPRLEKAKAAARQVLRGLGGGDAAMVVRMDGQTTPLSRFDGDVPRLLRTVDRIEATDTPADLRRALVTAADALRGRRDPMIVLVGDGAYPEEVRELVAWEPPAPSAAQAGAAAGSGGAAGAAGAGATGAAGAGATGAAGAGATGAAGTGATGAAAPNLAAIDLSGIDVRFIPVGRDGRNVGIVAFNVRRYLANKLSYEVLVELQNFGSAPEDTRLTLFAGDDAVDVKTLRLAAGERRREIYPDLGGGDDHALRAELQPLGADGKPAPDVFALDDVAWALLPARKKEKVLLVSDDNLYLEAALLLDSNISVDKVRPAEYEAERAAGRLEGYAVTVLDAFTPARLPTSPGILWFRPGEGSPFAFRREIARPFITDVDKDHAVTRWVTLADVNIDRAAVFDPAPGDAVLARAVRDPVIVAGRRAGHKVVAFGFALDGTDLMLRVAFPVMLVNALDWFAGSQAELLTTYRTGATWSVPVGDDVREVVVAGPAGRVTAPAQDGRARFYGQHVGIYTLEGPDGVMAIAANLADPRESDIRPQRSLVLGGRTLGGAPSFGVSASRSIWTWLVLAAVLLSAVEWLTYNRRLTV